MAEGRKTKMPPAEKEKETTPPGGFLTEELGEHPR
jgi:hypothetical protein